MDVIDKLARDSKPGKGNRQGRPRAGAVRAADKEAIFRVYGETGNMAETARRTGWSYQTVWNVLKAEKREELARSCDVGPPRPWKELNPQEKGWLTNFAEFRRHFFNRETPPFQQQIADLVSRREYHKLAVLTPPGHGKGISLDSPILTTSKWKLMGDIEVGDWVFDRDGLPSRVIATSGVNHRPCYRVRFADKTELIADDEHQWYVFNNRLKREVKVSTPELVGLVSVGVSVPVAKALDTPPLDLPVDPYLFGYWLGDGDSQGGVITIGRRDYAEATALLESTGAVIKNFWKDAKGTGRVRVHGLTRKLNLMGVQDNKHIPSAYLRASRAQRLALLQGLMDSDGCATSVGACEFVSHWRHLIEQVAELVRTLGIRCSVSPQVTYLKGKAYPSFRLAFSTDVPVFRLQRKLDRLKKGHPRRSWIRIQSVEQIESVPTKCIQVASPTASFLAGDSLKVVSNSQCFSVDYPIWEMIRQRAHGTKDGWACMLISKSDKMAQAFLHQIKMELEQNTDLQLAYGRFKPEYPDIWRRDQLTVEGFPIRKEPTFISAGAGSRIYGWRVHLIVGDDIVDTENSKTPEKALDLATWYADELMSRLEPEGVALNVGTRFSIYDLHGKLLRQEDDEGNALWHPILYRAHDDSKCSGVHCDKCKERCKHDKPWPDGCVLWPARFGWRALRALRSGQTSSARFEFLYNQYEIPDEGALVKPEWSEKCKNYQRCLWEFPQKNLRIMCTLDPSPVNWAVAHCWGYDQDDDVRYLIAAWRKRRVLSPEYLTLIRNWTTRLRQMGREPIWVVEVNAAQRWLLQSTEYLAMRAEMGLSVIPHTTGRNKADPELGVQTLSPAFEFRRVDLPWGDPESRKVVTPLLEEVHTYPMSETTDHVMAMWFMQVNIRRLQMPSDTQWLDYAYVPPYLLERRAIIDTHTGLVQKVATA